MANVLTMTVGLPRSGKSTWAKAQGVPIVNADAIRLGLHGQAFIGLSEDFVWAIAKVMVRALFHAGHDHVILDTTSVTKHRRKAWKSSQWIRQYQVFDTPKEECIRRAHDTDQEYLVPIIEKMAADWEPLDDEDWEDKEFLGYVEIHSRTEAALFNGRQISRLYELAGELLPDNRANSFYSLGADLAQPLVDKARERLDG